LIGSLIQQAHVLSDARACRKLRNRVAPQALSRQQSKEDAMAYQPGRNPFNPLIIGAIAVIVALVAFLVFRDGSETRRQAGINSQPPASTTPAPNPAPPPVSAPQKTPQ
jgi:hypothetical protein